MKILIFQHEPHEDPGYIIEWARKNDMKIDFVELYKNQKVPSQHDYDLLIIMGGSMSVNDEEIYSWLIDEKKFVLDGISLQKKIVGICLGSQILANCLGSKVYPNKWKEIGFFDVFTLNQDHPILRNIPQQFVAFHWHGETFDLPENALHLAWSEACKNQAFIWNNHILGLQFHLEVNIDLLNNYINSGNEEINTKDKFVQNSSEILAGVHYLNYSNKILTNILNNFLQL